MGMTCSIPDPNRALKEPPSDGPGAVVPSMAPREHLRGGATSLADLTTMRVGGPIDTLVRAHSEEEIIEAVRGADEAGRPLLMVGGGSNILASDEPFDGVVVIDERSGITGGFEGGCAGVTITAPAGQPWDELVALTIAQEWMGMEALSGIPGSVGATPVQNVGAYGQEVAETIAQVRVWDRLSGRRRTLVRSELEFGYRTSIIKRSLSNADAGGGRTWGPSGRYIVLSVTFEMREASLSSPIRYAQLASTLGVAVGERVPTSALREAVLELRRSKGMVLDPADYDTWSAGSFFTNPIVSEEDAANLPEGAPRMPVTDGTSRTNLTDAPKAIPGLVKTSAAWLIDHAGFSRGFGAPGPATLSTKHVLALTNRGSATSADLVALARTVRDGVRQAYGIELVPEPVVLGEAI